MLQANSPIISHALLFTLPQPGIWPLTKPQLRENRLGQSVSRWPPRKMLCLFAQQMPSHAQHDEPADLCRHLSESWDRLPRPPEHPFQIWVAPQLCWMAGCHGNHSDSLAKSPVTETSHANRAVEMEQPPAKFTCHVGLHPLPFLGRTEVEHPRSGT